MRVPPAEQEKEGVLHVGQCPVCGHVWLPWNWKVTWLPPTPPTLTNNLNVELDICD
jgi:hypothetical protein